MGSVRPGWGRLLGHPGWAEVSPPVGGLAPALGLCMGAAGCREGVSAEGTVLRLTGLVPAPGRPALRAQGALSACVHVPPGPRPSEPSPPPSALALLCVILTGTPLLTGIRCAGRGGRGGQPG